ncbi:type I-E CRISPR-associated protein Cas6/Cse3/CasE [Fibrella sp. HMF5335]|uniref:Type I-E CRISPR-associated protein Cas6/Cse3/CasE n=2 Tax=Fibrella rubiginis TaxID=2817060 RepID=A0A939GGG5_9BACT|nr:type I-E CRISPR-associated protein Cas6/Cse3/CasE [Fibrella rubiginis]
MHLSKLVLNPRRRDVWRDLRSPYDLHRTLAHAFPTEPGINYRAQHGVLFRLEPMTTPNAMPTVLVQSASPPEWSCLPEGYCLQQQSAPYDPTFAAGQSLVFRLVANPTKKQKINGREQGKRVALHDLPDPDAADPDTPTPARLWLTRKAEQHGFRVVYTLTDGFWLGEPNGDGARGKPQLPHYGVRYDGLLQVTNPDTLTKALTTGIGPAKAFGFGLLSVARPQ